MALRFECPSSGLFLRKLVRRAKLVSCTSLALSLVLHGLFSLVWQQRQKQQSAKPLTMQFVKRQPRLTKPLELKKRPRSRKRMLRREMVSLKVRADRQMRPASLQAAQMARSLARPSIAMARAAGYRGEEAEPLALAETIQGAKEYEGRVDMALEMVDVQALDTGHHRAMVIEDPADRRLIKGFLHLGVVYCETIFARNRGGWSLNVVDYIRNVVHAMNLYTSIRTDVEGYYALDSREMLAIPWVFLNTNGVGFKLTRSEAASLGTYLATGGFLLLETSNAHTWDGKDDSRDVQYRHELIAGQNMLKDALAASGYRYGQHWTFEKFSNDHPLYHCYFDFEGPLASWRPRLVSAGDAMRGITVDERVLAVFETGDYERFINNIEGVDGTRYRQFLVNVVVFALTQEGSLTQRLMNTVNY